MLRYTNCVIVALVAALWLVPKDGNWGTTIFCLLALWTVAALGTVIAALPLDYLARSRPALRITAWTLIGLISGWLGNGQEVGPPMLAFAALGVLLGSVRVLSDNRTRHP